MNESSRRGRLMGFLRSRELEAIYKVHESTGTKDSCEDKKNRVISSDIN